MASEREIRVVISSDPSGAITGLRMVGDETGKLGTKGASALESFKKNWLAVTAGATAAYLALGKIWSLMEEAAKFEERMGNLDRLTRAYGTSAESLVGTIQANSRGLIGMKDAAEVATDALAKGFTPEQVANMSRYAEMLSKTSATTMTAGEAFRMMEQSIVSARERGVVRLMGAEIDLEAALGRRAATLSKAQKAQEMYNLVTQAAEKRLQALGPFTDSAADRMERFNNSINALKRDLGSLLLIIGQPLMSVFNVGLTLAYGLAGAIATVISHFARLTDFLKLTKGSAASWEKRAQSMYDKSAAQAQQAVTNMKGAVSAILGFGENRGGGALGANLFGNEGENRKAAEKIEDLIRDYTAKREELTTAELDRELIKANEWFNEQKIKLDELGATQEAYNAMYATYSEMYDKAERDRATKISDFYREEQAKRAEERIAAERAASDAIFDEQERRARERLELENLISKAIDEHESARIRRVSQSEQEILRIRQQKVLAQIDENTTFEETNRLMTEYWNLEKDIEAIKRREVTELDARRVELQRELIALTREQEALKADASKRAIMESPGGSNPALGNLLDFAKGQDPYQKEYEQWKEKQDQKIYDLAEIYGPMAAETQAAQAELLARQDQRDMDQKIGLTKATFGTMGGILMSFYRLSGEEGKKAFKTYQAFAMAEAVISTAAGVARAFKDYQWPYSMIVALAVLAAGMAQVSTIAAARPGSRSMTSPSGGGVVTPTLPESERPESKAPMRSTTVNINILGPVAGDLEAFARTLVPHIQEAYAAGVRD